MSGGTDRVAVEGEQEVIHSSSVAEADSLPVGREAVGRCLGSAMVVAVLVAVLVAALVAAAEIGDMLVARTSTLSLQVPVECLGLTSSPSWIDQRNPF